MRLILDALNLIARNRDLLKTATKPIRVARMQRFATPKALRNALVRDEVEIGSTIRIDGYLSRYAHLQRPVSFANVQIDTIRAASRGDGKPRKNPDGSYTATFGMAWRVTQNPITSLPPFLLDDVLVRCLFLYPNSHDRFIYAVEEGNSLQLPDIRSPRTPIPEHAWPIPVLVLAEKALAVAEKRARLVAVVRELPTSLSREFLRLYSDNYQAQVLSNFLLPDYQKPLCYCLSVLSDDQDTGFDRERSDPAPLQRATLYVEGHFEGEPPDRDSLIEAIPKEQRPGASNVMQTGKLVSIAAANELAVQVQSPNILGFYAETTPTKGIDIRMGEIKSVLESVQAKIPESNLKLDFLFDPERQYFFDEGGILKSFTTSNLNSEQESAREWLRGQDPSA